MKTIHKYKLKETLTQSLDLPLDCKFLTVQTQNGFPCIWVLLETEPVLMGKFIFTTIGTGHEYKESMGEYFGTYQIYGGALVYHVFINKP